MRNGYEQEIDSKKLLEHLLQSGTEKKQESDEDSYLAAVLLLRVRSSQFDMSLSGRVERSAWAKVQDVSRNAATRLQALHPFWVLLSGETWIFQIILTNLLDLSLSRMGIRELAAPRSSLLVLNSMLRHSHVLQFFHLQSIVTYLLVDAVLLMHQ